MVKFRIIEYGKALDVTEAITDNVKEKLANAKPGTDEFDRLSSNLVSMTEAKQNETNSRNSYLAGLVPSWLMGAAGLGLSYAVYRRVEKREDAGGVISSQGVNVWDKIANRRWW